MAFPNITQFKETMIDGGARPSLFQMSINWPASVTASSILAARDLPFQCRISEIPGTAQNPVIVKYAGREIKFAGQRVYNPLNVTIFNDESFKVRRALEAWFDAMNTRETNVAPLSSPTGDPSRGYGGTGIVTQYTKQGGTARAYVFIDMFPVNLAPIPLDWQNDAMIEDYNVEFAYQHWVPLEEYVGNAVVDAFRTGPLSF